MSKQGPHKFWRMKIEKLKKNVGKGEIGKTFHWVWKVFGDRGKSETGGNASLPQRGWTPLAWRSIGDYIV